MSTDPTCTVPGCSRPAWKRVTVEKANRDDESWLVCRAHHWTISQKIRVDVGNTSGCRIKGCDRPRFARGLCKNHDKLARYHEAIDLVGTPASGMPAAPRVRTSDDLGLLADVVAPAAVALDDSPPTVEAVTLAAEPEPALRDHVAELAREAMAHPAPASPWHVYMDNAPIGVDELLAGLPWADLVRLAQVYEDLQLPCRIKEGQIRALVREHYAPELKPKVIDLIAQLLVEASAS